MNDYRPVSPAERLNVLIPPDASASGSGQGAPAAQYAPARQNQPVPQYAPAQGQQYAQPQPNQPLMPQYAPVQMNQPARQYAQGQAYQPAPQYAQPQYAQPQYAQPQYAQPQYAQPRQLQPVTQHAPVQPYPAPYAAPARRQVSPALRGLRHAANMAGFAAVASPLLQLVCSYAVSYLSILLMRLFGIGSGLDQNGWQLFVTAIAYPVSFILPVLLLRLASGRPLCELLSLRRPGALYMTSVPLMTLGTALLGAIITALINSLTSAFGVVSSNSSVQPASYGFFDILFYFFLMAVLPAFLEEFLFRGALLSVLRPYGDGFAVITTAALFSIIHCNFNQSPSAFLTGLLFGYAAVISGSIWPTVLAHFTNNALAIGIGLICDALPYDTANLVNLIVNAVYLLGGVIGCVILFRKSRPQLRLSGGEGHFSAGRLFGTTVSRPGIIVFLAVCLLLTVSSFHAG